MNRTSLLCAVLLAAVASAGDRAFAQAGSAGGTLGKTDKSLSGDRETAPAPQLLRTHRAATSTKAADERHEAVSGCGRILGTWKWFNGVDVVFKVNGTGEATNGTTATWVCDGGMYKVTWNAGNMDRITLAADGQTLSGVSSILGYPISATRK